jgi:predicted ATPase/DNA-binding CsgD family transcriptional regulator
MMDTPPEEQPSFPITQLHPVPDGTPDAVGNLPAPLTSLIGREAEIAAACALLQREDVRLVTLTGPGGVGKTQLALAIARAIAHDFSDGVFFVPLAPIRDPAHVAPAIAQEFDVRDSDMQLLLNGLRLALRERDVLLVIDNFEHVTAAAPLMVDLLTASPKLEVLVTSRELLHLSGEHAFEVPPLAVPGQTQPQSIDEFVRFDAIRLFVARAQEATTDFALTDANAKAVAEICQSLDGIPLALELAAARVRVLAPADLLAQLCKRLQFLTGGHRDAPERLQTMRHAIAWSYDLLTPDEQLLFRRLSVFVGGFTLAGAEAVGEVDAVLDLLTSLVDKSLVRQVAQLHGETRFSMLESVREFGLEQLAASGEEKVTRDAHAAAFTALGEAAMPHFGGDGWLEWMDKVEAEFPNCHAALEWADIRGDAETVARLAGALWRAEFARGYPGDAGHWLERALAMRDGVSTNALIEVLIGAGCYYTFVFDDSARAQMLSQELITLGDELGDANAADAGHNYLGRLALLRSDYAEATAHYRAAVDLAARLPDPASGMAWAIFGLANVAFRQGDLEAAATGFVDVLARSRESDYTYLIQESSELLGQVRLAQGNIKDAAALMAEGLGLAWDTREHGGMADLLSDLAMVAVRTGQVREVAHLFGMVEAMRLRHGHHQELSCALDVSQATLDARRAMGDEAFTAAHAAGQAMSLEEAIPMAFAVAEQAQSGSQPLSADLPGHGLTPRELDVLHLLVEGLSDKEIAEKLGTTRRTASKHVEMIRDKFAVPSRTAAVTYATRHGIV